MAYLSGLSNQLRKIDEIKLFEGKDIQSYGIIL